MSYWVDTEFEIDLKIPKKDFPLKSDTIVGYELPKLVYPDDEGSDDVVEGIDEGDYFVFKGNYSARSNNCYIEDDLKDLCVKYKGTFLAKMIGEDGEVDYIRVRKGVVKKVKIIEEEE